MHTINTWLAADPSRNYIEIRAKVNLAPNAPNPISFVCLLMCSGSPIAQGTGIDSISAMLHAASSLVELSR